MFLKCEKTIESKNYPHYRQALYLFLLFLLLKLNKKIKNAEPTSAVGAATWR